MPDRATYVLLLEECMLPHFGTVLRCRTWCRFSLDVSPSDVYHQRYSYFYLFSDCTFIFWLYLDWLQQLVENRLLLISWCTVFFSLVGLNDFILVVTFTFCRPRRRPGYRSQSPRRRSRSPHLLIWTPLWFTLPSPSWINSMESKTRTHGTWHFFCTTDWCHS